MVNILTISRSLFRDYLHFLHRQSQWEFKVRMNDSTKQKQIYKQKQWQPQKEIRMLRQTSKSNLELATGIHEMKKHAGYYVMYNTIKDRIFPLHLIKFIV